MRATVCAIVAAIGLLAQPAFAQGDRTAPSFWKAVQATCNATAAKPASEVGQRIAKTAIDEFDGFGGHKIDANGRLFHFGLTEAEHEEDEGGSQQATLGHLGWWRIMKYWRTLYGGDPTDKLEVRAYEGASTSTKDTDAATLLRPSAADLLHAAAGVTDPEAGEALREAAMRAAIVDTSWSAAFISYVVRESGVPDTGFQFSNAHRAYIYDAFATSAAEIAKTPDAHIYRACPLATTKPRVGDMICAQREPTLTDMSDEAVRERIRTELSGSPAARTIRRSHCEVVAHIDRGARKIYSIGGNVNQAVSARKMDLRRDMKFSMALKGNCGGAGSWTLPRTGQPQHGPEKCSLNDKKWFVLLQLR